MNSLPPYDDPEYQKLPCTREAIDQYLKKRWPTEHCPVRYPDEWYADKNNRIEGKPTGHIRIEGVRSGNMKAVWVSHLEAVDKCAI